MIGYTLYLLFSYHMYHEIHHFLFVMAVNHIFCSCMTVSLALLKVLSLYVCGSVYVYRYYTMTLEITHIHTKIYNMQFVFQRLIVGRNGSKGSTV